MASALETKTSTDVSTKRKLMEHKNQLVVIIMCGAPCTGKTTWIEKNKEILRLKYNAPVVVVSRDIIRESVYGSVKHKQTKKKEDEVSKLYYKQLSQASMLDNAILILDNTHLRMSYIESYETTFKSLIDKGTCKFFIKFTETPYWKVVWRNIWRKWKTGKFIPWDVLRNYYFKYIFIKDAILKKYKDFIYE